MYLLPGAGRMKMIKQGAPRLFLHENVPNFPVSLAQNLLGLRGALHCKWLGSSL